MLSQLGDGADLIAHATVPSLPAAIDAERPVFGASAVRFGSGTDI
jgi:hypothetical protein